MKVLVRVILAGMIVATSMFYYVGFRVYGLHYSVYFVFLYEDSMRLSISMRNETITLSIRSRGLPPEPKVLPGDIPSGKMYELDFERHVSQRESMLLEPESFSRNELTQPRIYFRMRDKSAEQETIDKNSNRRIKHVLGGKSPADWKGLFSLSESDEEMTRLIDFGLDPKRVYFSSVDDFSNGVIARVPILIFAAGILLLMVPVYVRCFKGGQRIYWRFFNKNVCFGCGYFLNELSSNVCPECGQTLVGRVAHVDNPTRDCKSSAE